ncbi:transposase, partial [Enterococcus faecium]
QANSKEEANTFLSGMIEKWKKNYPKAKYQHCCIHVSRNIAHKVRVKDR